MPGVTGHTSAAGLVTKTLPPGGRVRPPRALLVIWYSTGDPNTLETPIRAPFAGLTKGSSSESPSAIDTPPIARWADGRMSNWSPCARRTVRIAMSWAEAGDARTTRRGRIERRATHANMHIHHHPAEGTP